MCSHAKKFADQFVSSAEKAIVALYFTHNPSVRLGLCWHWTSHVLCISRLLHKCFPFLGVSLHLFTWCPSAQVSRSIIMSPLMWILPENPGRLSPISVFSQSSVHLYSIPMYSIIVCSLTGRNHVLSFYVALFISSCLPPPLQGLVFQRFSVNAHWKGWWWWLRRCSVGESRAESLTSPSVAPRLASSGCWDLLTPPCRPATSEPALNKMPLCFYWWWSLRSAVWVDRRVE